MMRTWESNATQVGGNIITHSETLMSSFYCQLMTTTDLGTYGWWEDSTAGRVEWRQCGLESGALSAQRNGTTKKLKLCVNNWGCHHKVGNTIKFPHNVIAYSELSLSYHHTQNALLCAMTHTFS